MIIIHDELEIDGTVMSYTTVPVYNEDGSVLLYKETTLVIREYPTEGEPDGYHRINHS